MPYLHEWISIPVIQNNTLTHNFIVRASLMNELDSCPENWQKHRDNEALVVHLEKISTISMTIRPVVLVIVDTLTRLEDFPKDVLKLFYDTVFGHFQFDLHIRKLLGIETQYVKGASDYFPKFGDYKPCAADVAGIGSGERKNWLVVSTQNRDSGTLDRSNFQTIKSELERISTGTYDFPDYDWELIRQSHWAVGWIELIVVNPDNVGLEKWAKNIGYQLENHIMLDEGLWTQLECELEDIHNEK